MILSLNLELKIPIKNDVFFEDIKELENAIGFAIHMKIKESGLLTPQLEITSQLKHDAEEIKSRRGKESRL